ncbi:MAG: molybdopterin cofactor-binding domain-containing protein, partial [Anaerolineaceae bacterium]
SAIMQMNGDGRVRMMIGGVDIGQGAYTAMAQIAAQELDLPIEHIDIMTDIDTRANPYDWNTVASKLTFMGGNAVINASRELLQKMKEVAAQVLKTEPKYLAHANGEIYHVHNPERKLTYKQIALGYMYPGGTSIGGPLMATGTYIADGLTNLHPETGQGAPALVWTFGAHAVEIEVDVETGSIEVLKVASAFDIGQVINEKLVYGQICGGVMQGLGSAILEGYKFSNDVKLMNPSFTDNKIPTMKDMPKKIVPIYIENPQHNGPYGARGVGEHPMISIPSAVGNAVYDALGINFHVLPLSPEAIVLGIESGKKSILCTDVDCLPGR